MTTKEAIAEFKAACKTERKKVNKKPMGYYGLSYTYCFTCGSWIGVAKSYLREMKRTASLECGCCHSPNITEISKATWDHYRDVKAREQIFFSVAEFEPKQSAPFEWDIYSHTKIGKLYTVKLLPGDVWTCTCIGFDLACISHNSDCIHIKEIKSENPGISRPDTKACVGASLESKLEERKCLH